MEKYIISELAKYSELEDLNIYHTHDFKDLMKVRNDKEYVNEEIPEELSQQMKQTVVQDDVSTSKIVK